MSFSKVFFLQHVWDQEGILNILFLTHGTPQSSTPCLCFLGGPSTAHRELRLLGEREGLSNQFLCFQIKTSCCCLRGSVLQMASARTPGIGLVSTVLAALVWVQTRGCLHGCIFSLPPQTLLPTAPRGLSSDLESNYQVFSGQEDTFFPLSPVLLSQRYLYSYNKNENLKLKAEPCN